MTGKDIKDRLRSGGRVTGMIFHYITNPAIVEVLPDEGLDFVIVNVEHNALGLSDYLGLQFALHSRGIACLARVHSRDPDDVTRACDSFRENCIDGLELDEARVTDLMQRSLMLVTALNRHIGYDNAAKVAKKAHAEGTTLREAVVALGLMSGAEFDAAVIPAQMVGPRS